MNSDWNAGEASDAAVDAKAGFEHGELGREDDQHRERARAEPCSRAA